MKIKNIWNHQPDEVFHFPIKTWAPKPRCAPLARSEASCGRSNLGWGIPTLPFGRVVGKDFITLRWFLDGYILDKFINNIIYIQYTYIYIRRPLGALRPSGRRAGRLCIAEIRINIRYTPIDGRQASFSFPLVENWKKRKWSDVKILIPNDPKLSPVPKVSLKIPLIVSFWYGTIFIPEPWKVTLKDSQIYDWYISLLIDWPWKNCVPFSTRKNLPPPPPAFGAKGLDTLLDLSSEKRGVHKGGYGYTLQVKVCIWVLWVFPKIGVGPPNHQS